MSFLHVSLLAGMAFALIPVLIHISGRRQPKPILFPALQFVRTTKIASARGWNVKRWLLLLLRIAMLCLLALALASPRVHQASFASWISIGTLAIGGVFAAVVAAFAFAGKASNAIKYTALLVATLLLSLSGVWSTWVMAKGPNVPMQSSTGPVAAVIIVDTSPTMDYRFENQTRLDKAKEFANWIVGRLDAQSMIAVLTGSFGERLQIGHAAAETAIERLQVEGTTTDLLGRIRKGIELVRESKLNRHEIYVVTDLSANAWLQDESAIQAILNDGEPILLQIVDVGAKEHINWGIDQVSIRQDVAPIGSTVQIDVKIKSVGQSPAKQLIVELVAEQQEPGLPRVVDRKLVTPKTQVLDRKIIEATGGLNESDLTFQVTNLQAGTNNYHLRLLGSDPLAIDGEVAFTLEGFQAGRILVVDGKAKDAGASPANASTLANEADLLALMLDTTEANTTKVKLSSLEQMQLSGTAVIAVWNPPLSIPQATVAKLEQFVNDGGKLILVLGDSIDAKQLAKDDKSPIDQLLPGRISRLTRRPQGDAIIENIDLNHRMWAEFGREIANIPWSRFAIFRHWDIDDLKSTARPLARYTASGYPAIIEDTRNEGTIITFTTPIPDLERNGYETWNELTTSPDAWVAFGTMLGTGRYLQSSEDLRRNFTVGETAFVEWNQPVSTNRYELFHPDGTEEQVKLNGQSILYGFTQRPGHYRMRAVNSTNDVRGFAVQLAANATNLQRIRKDQLDEFLGEGNYVVAEDKDGLQQSIGQGRYGRDMAPFLLLVLAGVFFAEQAMAQNFYSQRSWNKTLRRS